MLTADWWDMLAELHAMFELACGQKLVFMQILLRKLSKRRETNEKETDDQILAPHNH